MVHGEGLLKACELGGFQWGHQILTPFQFCGPGHHGPMLAISLLWVCRPYCTTHPQTRNIECSLKRKRLLRFHLPGRMQHKLASVEGSIGLDCESATARFLQLSAEAGMALEACQILPLSYCASRSLILNSSSPLFTTGLAGRILRVAEVPSLFLLTWPV